MSRRMSCSMTVAAVRDRTQTVTRRHVDTWKNLRVGDRLTLIEKGARQVVLDEVEVTDVRVEPIGMVARPGEVAREGFPAMSDFEFVDMWMRSHGYGPVVDSDRKLATECRRIEWRYVDDDADYPGCIPDEDDHDRVSGLHPNQRRRQ